MHPTGTSQPRKPRKLSRLRRKRSTIRLSRRDDNGVIFETKNVGTKVTIMFRNIPPGIQPGDNEVCTRLTFEKLARYVEKTCPFKPDKRARLWKWRAIIETKPDLAQNDLKQTNGL